MGVGGERHTPAALPPGKTRYPLYKRLGRLQSRSGRVRKISPLPGFDPQTVQPIASRYPGPGKFLDPIKFYVQLCSALDELSVTLIILASLTNSSSPWIYCDGICALRFFFPVPYPHVLFTKCLFM
jgi:hypothetical protein